MEHRSLDAFDIMCNIFFTDKYTVKQLILTYRHILLLKKKKRLISCVDLSYL